MIRKTLIMLTAAMASALLSLSACTSDASGADAARIQAQRMAALEQQRLLEEQQSVWDSALADDSRFTIGIKLSPAEKRFARQFAKTTASNLRRSNVYVHYLLTKLKENNLPVELASIPLIESGLNPHVRANGGAHGPWQYLRATGSSLGLKKRGNYDAIYDFFASTDASIKYLKKLYADLGDWQLVVAAYNQGEYGIKKAVDRAYSQGVKHPGISSVKLSRGASAYVKKFRAVADILRNPQDYGVSLPEIKNRPAFRRVDVAGRINSLNEAAKLSGAGIDVIKKLNSGYLTDKIDSHHGLIMPIEHAGTLESAIGIKPKDDNALKVSRLSSRISSLENQ